MSDLSARWWREREVVVREVVNGVMYVEHRMQWRYIKDAREAQYDYFSAGITTARLEDRLRAVCAMSRGGRP